MEDTLHHLTKHIASVEQDVSGSIFHSLPVGGRMAYYTVVRDSVELVQAVKAACDISLPYLVVGQGTSVVIHDDGFPGLVIHNQSKNIAFSVEQSQLVVESGAALQVVIVQAAERGLGGLIHLYPKGGSIGGALFYNVGVNGQTLFDSLRSLTMLMPPTRIKPEPSIVRFKGSWLLSKSATNMTKLQTLVEAGGRDFQPVILTAQLQLTSLRMDELARRIQVASHATKEEEPKQPVFGPVFLGPQSESLQDILKQVEVHKIKHQGFSMNKYVPNYIQVKQRYIRENGDRILVHELLAFVDQVRAHVLEQTQVELQISFSIR